MNIVELYSGTCNFSNEMKRRGHNVISIDYRKDTPATIHADVSDYSYEDLCNLFENSHIDFIFAAPDSWSYNNSNSILKSNEQLLWENILNNSNCKFIVEHISGRAFNENMAFRKNKITFYLDYGKFKTLSNRIAPISTNCTGLEEYIQKNMDKQFDYNGYKHYIGETPFKLVKIIADYIESIISKKEK